VTRPDAAMPKIDTYVQVLDDAAEAGGAYTSPIVVGQLSDPALGDAVELRLSDSRRMQRLA
jgi:hypothetical protein